MSFILKIFEKSEKFEIKSKYDVMYANILIILVCLFPISLLTGPFLPDLTIFICSFFFIYLIFKYKLFEYFNNYLFKFFFIFWIYIVLNSLLSENISFSLKSSFFYARFFIFSVFISFLIKNYNYFTRYFFYFLTLTLIIVLIESFLQFFFGKGLMGFEKPGLRLTGPFGDRQIVGSFIMRLLPLYLFLFYFINHKVNYKLISFLFLLTILVLISGERTAFFGLSLFIFSIYILFEKKLLKFLSFLLFYFFTSILIVYNNADLKERIVDQTLQGIGIKQYTFETGEDIYFKQKPDRGFYLFSRAHEVHFMTAFKMFKDSPIIGKGPNMYRKKCSDEKFFIEQSSCTTHPHNFILQIMAETGLLGTFFYLFIFFSLMKKILFQLYLTKIKKLELSLKQVKLYFLNIGFVVNAFIFILPNGNFFNNYLNAIIYLPLGFYLYQLNKHE